MVDYYEKEDRGDYASRDTSMNKNYDDMAVAAEPKRPAEIHILMKALDEVITDVGDSFSRLQDKISPVCNNGCATPSEARDKRGADTQLGDTLSTMLDRLQILRERIQATTGMVEL